MVKDDKLFSTLDNNLIIFIIIKVSHLKVAAVHVAGNHGHPVTGHHDAPVSGHSKLFSLRRIYLYLPDRDCHANVQLFAGICQLNIGDD